MAPFKFTLFDITTVPQNETRPSNMKLRNKKWINANVQACIEPPPIPLINTTAGKMKEFSFINIKMRQDSAAATSDNYKLKFQTFKIFKSEELLSMMKDFRTTTDGTDTTYATRNFQFLRIMLRGGALREFDVIASKKLAVQPMDT